MTIVSLNLRMQRAEHRVKHNQQVFQEIGRKPFGTRVLVEIPTDTTIDEKGDVKKGSIYIPQEAKDKEERDATVCKIVAIGADAFYDVYDAPEVGDWVVLKRYSGIDIRGKDGKRYRAPIDVDIYVGTSDDSDVDYLG